jgi:TolA-binding protein
MGELGKRLHDALEKGPSKTRRAAQMKEVEAMYRLPSRRSTSIWIPVAIAAALIAVTAIVLFNLPARPEPMEYWVGASTEPSTTHQLSAAEAPLPIRFTDGSLLELSPSSRLVVSEAVRGRVTLTLESGAIDVDIREKGATTWKLLAGPYTVTVHGTAFSVAWNASLKQLAVEVSRGLVNVKGPDLSPSGLMLGASESLHIDEPRRMLARNPQPPPEPAAPAAAAEEIEQVPEPAPKSKPSVPAWKKLADEGKHEEAIALVEADFDHLVKTLKESDLWTLATTARLAHEGALAASAYQAFRKRFPDSPRSATAVFLLGRVEMEQNKNPAKAAQWFQTYLEKHPDGSFAEDALGRLISAHRKAGNSSAAKKAASSYLDKHPAGTFRELALSVVSNP